MPGLWSNYAPFCLYGYYDAMSMTVQIATSNTTKLDATMLIPSCFEVVVHGFKGMTEQKAYDQQVRALLLAAKGGATNVEAMKKVAALYKGIFATVPVLSLAEGIHNLGSHLDQNPLGEGEDLINDWGEELDADTLALLEASKGLG